MSDPIDGIKKEPPGGRGISERMVHIKFRSM
jgi:hypothetical protein